MPTIKYTREDITKLENERDQFQLERDSLIKDVEKLRKENKALRLQADEYFELWQGVVNKYNRLTEHIRLKALHNPSVSRYKDLMHFIDELEGGFND